MKNIREVKSPRWAATKVLNSRIDLAGEAIEENEKRAKKFQEPLPLPKFDVKKMVELTLKLTREAFEERRRGEGDMWFGNLGEWEYEALRTLRDDLQSYARKTNDEDLLNQIREVWPETKPPRDLIPEEIGRLVELQGQADELMENLTGTVKSALEELWNIIMGEAEIVGGTSGSRLLFKQAGEYVCYLEGLINTMWGYKTGSTVTSPDQIKLEIKTRRWTK